MVCFWKKALLNEKQKYEEFGKTVISATKLYVDSYMDDVFPSGKKNDYSLVPTLSLYKRERYIDEMRHCLVVVT